LPERTWDADELAEAIVEKIDEYLAGSLDGKGASQWAVQKLTQYRFASHELLLDEALNSLLCLGGDDPEWDTTNQELELLRSAMRGERDYPILLRWVPRAVVESVKQSRRSQTR